MSSKLNITTKLPISGQYFTGAVFIILFLLMSCQSTLAIAPPLLGDRQFPDYVVKAQDRMYDNFQFTEIAKRLRHIKSEKEAALQNGQKYSSETVNMAVPVIVGNYTDNSHIFSVSDYQNLLFGENPTGNMTDYYNEVSYGQFNLTGTVYGTYTASESQAYYCALGNGLSTNYPYNAFGFVYSIVDAADSDIDFGQYDNDGPDGIPNSGDDDGIVDGLIVITPDGDACSNDVDNMWAHFGFHFWYGAPEYVTDDPRSGGGNIEIHHHVTVGSELGDGTWDVIMPIPVYCHEFGHSLGLPDLYDVDGSSMGVGGWGLMSQIVADPSDTGEQIAYPLHMCAYSKVDLGWVMPIDISETETVNLPSVESTPIIYRLWEDAYQGGRYFLLENRTRTGFDSFLHGEGVLIWHCNEDVATHNWYDSFRLLDLEEADGLYHLDNNINYGDEGDPYPGSSSNTTFNGTSNPSSNDVYNQPTGVSAEGFAYAAGPGSDVTVTLTPRQLDGYTIAAQPGYSPPIATWSSTPISEWGCVEFAADEGGKLVGLQAVALSNGHSAYSVRIFEDMIAGSPNGLFTSKSGTFPSYPNPRYHEIDLPDTIFMISGQSFIADVKWGPSNRGVPYTSTNYPASGNSYFSEDGSSYVNWTDKDVMIRARIQYCIDEDNDSICAAVDNCDEVYNPEQADSDEDGIGNLCDNCPDVANPDQLDSDDNGIGDACQYVCGDASGDAAVNISDAVYLISYIFKGGPPPDPLCEGDASGDATVNVSDAVYLVNYIFKGGPAPVEPCCP